MSEIWDIFGRDIGHKSPRPYCPDFNCPAEIKEIKEILLPSLCAAISAISAISAGRLLSHADSILLSRFLLSRRNKGNPLTRPMRSPFCYFCYFCGTYYPMRIVFISRRNKGNQGNLVTLTRRALSAISAISSTSEAAKPMTAGRLLPHADSSFIVPIFIVPQK